jgi:hypothetical protein
VSVSCGGCVYILCALRCVRIVRCLCVYTVCAALCPYRAVAVCIYCVCCVVSVSCGGCVYALRCVRIVRWLCVYTVCAALCPYRAVAVCMRCVVSVSCGGCMVSYVLLPSRLYSFLSVVTPLARSHRLSWENLPAVVSRCLPPIHPNRTSRAL